MGSQHYVDIPPALASRQSDVAGVPKVQIKCQDHWLKYWAVAPLQVRCRRFARARSRARATEWPMVYLSARHTSWEVDTILIFLHCLHLDKAVGPGGPMVHIKFQDHCLNHGAAAPSASSVERIRAPPSLARAQPSGRLSISRLGLPWGSQHTFDIPPLLAPRQGDGARGPTVQAKLEDHCLKHEAVAPSASSG